MRSVHILGLGLVIGSIALGVVVVSASYRWAQVAFPAAGAPGAQQPGAQAAPAASADVTAGQTTFKQKCSSCHTVGGGKLVGPDLKGVTQQRPHDFLINFITAPDKVIASGDPTAAQLLKEYGAPMPNLGVTQEQAEQILAYVQFQTGGAAPAPAGAQPAPGGAAAPSPAAAATPAAGAPSAPAAAGDPNKGKAIFEQKCTSCHTIGGGDKVGPDLKGVSTRRSHDWLVAWITAPDQMIAKADPTAAQLLKQYTVPMPNLGLSKGDVEDVLSYVNQQSGGGAAAAPPPASTPAPAAPAPAAPTQPAPAAPTQPAPAAPAAAPAAPQGGFQPTGDPNKGKSAFSQKCASCHTIGGGKTVGPDLKGVTSQRPHDWLVNFIVAPDKVIASNDPTAAQLVKEYGIPMPNVGVSQADAEDILAYIFQQSGGQGAAPPGGAPGAPGGAPAAAPAGGAPAAAQITPGDAASGHALFTGEKRLSAGGPACIACHNAAGIGVFRGGTWGLDLTNAQSKSGTAGLVSIVKSPPFPGMKEAFANRPITDGEAADLAAFFINVDKQQAPATPELAFPLVGVAAFLIMLAIAAIAWRGRILGVRKQLVGGAGR